MNRILVLQKNAAKNKRTLPAAACSAVLALFLAVPAFGGFVYSTSSVTLATGTFTDTPVFGNTVSSSSVSMADIRVDVNGGINYGAQAFSSGTFGTFSLFAFAGGSATGVFIPTAVANAQTQVRFSDSLNIAGSGQARFDFRSWSMAPWMLSVPEERFSASPSASRFPRRVRLEVWDAR